MCSLQDRRDVEAVVDVRAALGGGQHVGEDLAVGAGAVEVVGAGADVGEPGGDAALRRGAALGRGVLGQRVVDPPVLVGVDDAGEEVTAGRVDDRGGLGRVDPLLDRGEAAVGDGDVEPAGCVVAGPDDLGAGDQQVVGAHASPSGSWDSGASRSTGSTRVSGCSRRADRRSGRRGRGRRAASRSTSSSVEAARGVVAELGGELVERQRALRAAAGGEHPLLELGAVVQGDPDDGRELAREDPRALLVGLDDGAVHQVEPSRLVDLGVVVVLEARRRAHRRRAGRP